MISKGRIRLNDRKKELHSRTFDTKGFRESKQTFEISELGQLLDTFDWWNSNSLTDERRNEFELKPNSMLLREKSIIENWKKSKR